MSRYDWKVDIVLITHQEAEKKVILIIQVSLTVFIHCPFLSTFFLPVSEIAIFVWQVKRIKSDPGDLAKNEQTLSLLD